MQCIISPLHPAFATLTYVRMKYRLSLVRPTPYSTYRTTRSGWRPAYYHRLLDSFMCMNDYVVLGIYVCMYE